MSVMPDDAEHAPRLPQDLECLIFERAASEWTAKCTSQLLLVAKRVRDWIRPLLFRVFFQLDRGYPDFQKYPCLKMEDVGRFVKHFIVGNDKLAHLLLPSCPNIYNLALWHGVAISKHLEVIRSLRLTRLSANFTDLLPEELLGPAFFNLTHLDIIAFGDPLQRWEKWAILADLPKLSHLAFSEIDEIIIRKCLLHCKCLQVLIILLEDKNMPTTGKLLDINDERLVLICGDMDVEQDWENGANGKVDFWITAELFSRARRGKFLCNPVQRWIEISIDWAEELNAQGKEWYSSSLNA